MQQAASEGVPGSAWERPVAIDDALRLLETRPCTVIAGGTDLLVSGASAGPKGNVLDLSAISSLTGIQLESYDGRSFLRIGATVTWSQLLRAQIPEAYEALRLAAREIGGRQIQNRGTIGGNLCNASPAADSVPVLLALEAELELCSPRGLRRMPVAQFLIGSRRTALAPDELLTAVCLPQPGAQTRSVFLKLGHRRYLVISIATVAAAVSLDAQGIVTHCAVAIGACSAVACRLPSLEQAILGLKAQELDRALRRGLLRPQMFEPIAPIDDVRGTAKYRREAVVHLVDRALRELIGQDSS